VCDALALIAFVAYLDTASNALLVAGVLAYAASLFTYRWDCRSS